MIQRIADVCTALLRWVRRWRARRPAPPLPSGYDPDEVDEVLARRRRTQARMQARLEEARRSPGEANNETPVQTVRRPRGHPFW
jgi:hypothetical protein